MRTSKKHEKKLAWYSPPNFDRRKVLTLIYIKFWLEACLPALLYDTELFTLTPTLLAKLERCQQWFLKNVFYVPKFASRQLLLKLSGLRSIESEIALRKLLFWGRLLTEDKMAPVLRNLFEIRIQSYFDANIVSLGTLPTICEVLQKYDLFNYFDTWFSDSVFQTYLSWKAIVRTKIREFEENAWIDFVQKHPSFKFARTCLDNVSPHKFWSISDQYPDLVCRLHVQIRLMGNFGFSADLPWASKAEDALCFICKKSNNNLYHFLFDCLYFRDNFDSLLSNLVIKATNCNSADASHVSSFLTNPNQHNKALMLVGCLPLPFDSVTVTVLTCFVASAVGKIYKLRAERLRELEAPWLRKSDK